jgi:oligopeptidase B
VQPPVAKQVAHLRARPTGPVDDPWAWLSDRDDPDVMAYLKAENANADAWLDGVADLREAIFGEIKSRTKETDESVPLRRGEWWYVSRTVEGLDYPIHCRGRDAATATEDVLLDENEAATGHDYFALGAFDVSPDHTLLAWSQDTTGGETYTMRVRDLATGTDLPDVLEGTYYGTAWSEDAHWLFYTRPDHTMRPWQVWRHRLGTSQADDVLVWQEDDERFFLSAELTRSEAWVVLASGSATTTEVRVVPAADPGAAPRMVRAREAGVEYALDHWGDRFVVLTNLDAEDFRVCIAPLDAPGSWTDLVAHQPGRRVTQVEAFDAHLALHEWADAVSRVRVLRADGTEQAIEGTSGASAVEIGANAEYATSVLRVEEESLVMPRTVWDVDLATGTRTLRKRTPVLDVDLGSYREARTWAVAPDGTRVPIDLAWRDGTPRDGTAPACVYGYGAYEVSLAPWFSIPRLSLLDRGAVFALAHVRGGGELGRRWYLDGKLEHKANSFTDLLAAADHIVDEGWAAPNRLAARGGSAGGLLVGAALAMRPERFAAVVAEVPFVDVVTTMSDPSLPLTATEWEEWGDPRQPDACARMAAYSPYDNVRPVAYPAMYVTAGLNDPRVSFHEPAKWVARIRAVTTGDRPVLLRTELGAGHAGPSGRYDAWRDEARVLAFLLRSLGAA